MGTMYSQSDRQSQNEKMEKRYKENLINEKNPKWIDLSEFI